MTTATTDPFGQVGELRAFRATLTARPPVASRAAGFWAKGGVLADAGAEALGRLAASLGPLTVTGYTDDARGGIEAEAVVGLETASGATGELVLTRLRALPSVVTLEGANGRIEVTLDSLPAGPDGAELVAACRALRTQLVHPWENPKPGPSGPLAGRKVLVIGATGFIGARLVEVLAEQGAIVTAAARNLSRAARIARFPVRLIETDLGNPTQVVGAVQGQEVVFSLAHDLDRSGGKNFEAYKRLAETAQRAGVKRFVHTSSIAAYDAWPIGDLTEASPRDAEGHEYKTTKRAIERDLEARTAGAGFTAAVLQPTLVYGPFSKLWTDRYAEWLRNGDVVLPDEGRGLCNAVYVDDLVQALILAGAAETPGAQAFIVSGAGPVAWGALLESYAAALPGKIVYEEAPPLQTAPSTPSLPQKLLGTVKGAIRGPAGELIAFLRARLGEDQFETLRGFAHRPSGPIQRPADFEPLLYRAQGTCSIDKARRDLGYAPAFDLDAGLARSNAYIGWKFGTPFR